jgi:uncharacterized protein
MLYLDTSVLISSMTNEPSTVNTQAWLLQQDASLLTISDWVETEFSSALSIKLRTGQLTPVHRGAALAQFAQLAANTFTTLPIDASAYPTAARFCDQSHLNLRAGDALHLAICANHGATICTLDQNMAQAAPQVGVTYVLL